MTNDTSRFRIRLRVRIAKGFTTEVTRLNVKVADRDVAIVSQKKDEPLNQAEWMVLESRGFTTEEAAQDFGSRLRWMMQVASLSSRLGVNAGDDKPTSWVNEDFIRSLGLIKDHERTAPNVHGLSILPDDDNLRFPIIDARGTVTADPEQFTSALRELGESSDLGFGAAANGLRLLNLALMAVEPLAQMVLAISAVEEIGQSEKWSKAQVGLIHKLADTAEASEDVTDKERAEVAQVIRKGLFPLSLRQGVKRLLSRLGLDYLWKEWDRLYEIRSGLFHGKLRLPDDKISQAAFDTITICAQIILTIAANEGTKIPSVTAKHFNLSDPMTVQDEAAKA